jgi:outer membrane protein assembly factor BamB
VHECAHGLDGRHLQDAIGQQPNLAAEKRNSARSACSRHADDSAYHPRMMHRPPGLFCMSLLAIAAAYSPAVEPDAADLLDLARTGAGLVVRIGTTDGQLEANLAANGRTLVHGLALTDAARDQARARILASPNSTYGLASVATWQDRTRLPYATNLATALIADLDALGGAAPAREELERVVAPGGTLLLREKGRWARTVKPRPAEMDNWGHFDHGADGGGTSNDQLVQPVRQQQWLAELMPTPDSGNPAGYDPGAGIRVVGRYAIVDVNDRHGLPEGSRERETWVLQCRDAFNGLPLWSLPRASAVARKRWALAATDAGVFTWLKAGEPLTALDLGTGKPLRTYAGAIATKENLDGDVLQVRVAGQSLIAGTGDRLQCYEVATGKLRWEQAREDRRFLAPVLDERRGRVYCILAQADPAKRFTGRWPVTRVATGVLALDLATGRQVWECGDAASVPVTGSKGEPLPRGIGQLVPGDHHLVVFGSAAISGGDLPYIGSIDLASGKLVQGNDAPFKRDYNVSSYNAVWRDGAAWFAGAFNRLWRFDPATGQVDVILNHSWNQRCTRLAATPKWFLFGQTAFLAPDASGEQVSVTRAGCALPSTPANGMTYFTPTACGCTTIRRGFQAMTGEPAAPPIPDAARLTAGSRPPLGPFPVAAIPAGLVAADWLKQRRAGFAASAPVPMAGLELATLPHQHRVQATRNGTPLWSFVADARISGPVVVAGDCAVFGAHDGCVYAVDATGKLRWRYRLAPSERWIAVDGQLESTWPIYGVALLDGALVASAGTHVELDGGVRVAALDPATGKPLWTRELAKHPSPLAPGGKASPIVAHSFINSVPRIANGRITLGDGGRAGGEFQFDPSEETAALNHRLNTPPPKPRK